MKKILFILFLLPIFAHSTNYYFANNGDDSRSSIQAQNPLTPWASITKLNSFFTSLNAGDSVLFKRGDTFYGSINCRKGGTSLASINFSAYGSGDDPIITGFSSVTSWTNLGSNIWESTNAVTSSSFMLNMVTVNGSFKAMGRYPKVNTSDSGYLNIDSHSGNTSITSTGLSGVPDYTGGQIVTRRAHWILDIGTVTSLSGTTVTFTNSDNVYSVQNNWGFFLQNSHYACTSQNEWYYNSSTKKIGMYSVGSPTGVQVASIDTLVKINFFSYINFSNLSFTGSNKITFYLTLAKYITFNNCTISYGGQDGIAMTSEGLPQYQTSNITINNCIISNINNIGIDGSNATYLNISNNNIYNIGLTRGMGVGSDQQYSGVTYIGSNSVFSYNNLSSIGYMGVRFDGTNDLVNYNYVHDFCAILDDGGGIYAPAGSHTGSVIASNIVINGIGAPNGTSGGNYAEGIYLDDGSSNISIQNNTISNCSDGGIFNHSGHELTFTGNTSYNSLYQSEIYNDQNTAANLSFKNNIFVSKVSSQYVLGTSGGSSPASAWFVNTDSNYYCRPIADNTVFKINGTLYTLSGWQTYSSQDSHSKKSPKTISDTSQIKFYYNETNSAKTFNLGAIYIDMAGNPYLGSVTLQPYTSVVLLFSSSNLPNPLSATITQNAPIICNGNTISLTAQGIGGTPPYTYLWTTGATTQTVIGIHSGNYSVQVTDAAGVIANQSIFVSQPSAITASVSFGTAPATVTTTANGGTGTLTYKLDAGSYQSSNIFTAVAAGNHTITIKDANSCTSSPINFTVISAGVPLAITASSSNPDCYGGNGSVTIGASGGTSPYTGTGVFAQAAGTVTYTVTDNVGGKHDTTITITNPPIITIVQITLDSSISVYGGTTRIYIAATGGTGSLQYKLDGGSYQSADSFSAVSAGNHIITVKDDNSCTQAQTFTLTQPSPTPSSYFILRRRKFKNG